MRRTAAVLGSWDTKSAEMCYMRTKLEEANLDVVLVDVSTKPSQSSPDGRVYTAKDILKGKEDQWSLVKDQGRAASIMFMSEATKDFVVGLQTAGKIDGIVSAGGLQNTTLAVSAMQSLPMGFPKVVATTVATGHRPFMSVVGDRDIVVIPAIADLSGINFATKATLNSACGCLAGLMRETQVFERPDRVTVGLSMMGVTNNAAVGAIRRLEQAGYEVVGFHATGAGGGVLEDFVGCGLFDAVLDLTLHEIVNEYFQGGYSFGIQGRLEAAIERNIPLVIAPGGLDFVDYFVDEFVHGIEGRKYIFHNDRLAHIKLTRNEAQEVGALVGKRIAKSTRPVVMVYPTQGLRSDTGYGQALYDPEVDEVLVQAIQKNAGQHLVVHEHEMNLDTEEFGATAAQVLINLLGADSFDYRQKDTR